MNVLVTGASGYLGKHVVPALLDAGHRVAVVSRNAAKITVLPWAERVECLELDLDDRASVERQPFAGIEVVVHLAWEGLPNYNGAFHYEQNLWTSYRFLKHVARKGVRRFVVAGTCLEYGLQEGALRENLDTRPITAYGLAKDTLRKFLEQLKRETDLELTWVRFFYLFGGDERPHSLLAQLERAVRNGESTFNMSGGEQLRDYLPVETAAARLARLAALDHGCGPVNCCSGNPISVRRLVEERLRRLGKHIRLNLGHYPYPEYEPMAFWGNPEKLRGILGDGE
ncbi:MAG: NAD-dependent epimerase/dehydratase family protein [Kiritimatiellaeota bacterium]|nr:NAD-dependent epimerase/dehydratase family protein [Kiritimatiellota bacterium]